MTEKINKIIISQVPLDFKEAHMLADLEGIKHDLEWVISAGKAYGDIGKQYFYIIPEALCIAIIVKYARVRMTGERRLVPLEWIKSLSKKEQEDHEYFMNLRNKFIAHSVNNLEENYSVAYIKNIDSTNPEFDQVQQHHSRVVSFSVLDIMKIISLAEKLLEKVQEQIEIEKPKVIEKAKKIPLNELIKHRLDNQISTKDNAGKSRSRKIKKS